MDLDTAVFLFLNKNLLNHSFAQHFWGILSHKHESWINIVVMLSLNFLAVFMIPKDKRSKAIAITIYCWLSFQVIILVNTLIFQKILQINRNSPSVVIGNAIKLSVVLNNLNLKDYSHNCFPAGHALVLMYWALFINLYAPRIMMVLVGLVCFLFTMPRMITGAHWLSDTLFSLVLGWIYFKFSMYLASKYANKYDRIKNSLY